MVPNIRVGLGFDVHRLVKGRELWLGGVKIECEFGCDGHSDADVLLHAICDALLGAAGLRDIGFHFPDTDASLKNIDSKILLAKVAKLLMEKDWSVGNIDATLALERPKINPYVPEMIRTIAKILHIEEGNVSVKATTNEKMGYVGNGEGVNAWAVAMIYRD
jgi:2-C-methyl-D-erythritol 2,4-cyclodiphosphate synthase